MTRIRGWGLLLALAFPFFVFFSWVQLGSEKARKNIERYEATGTTAVGDVIGLMHKHFVNTRTLAGPADVALPKVPAATGIQSWALLPDTTLRVVLDAKIDGQAVVLQYVPVVRGHNAMDYECVSATSQLHVRRICENFSVGTVDDLAKRLDANAEKIATFVPLRSAAGDALTVGRPNGSVMAVPARAQDLIDCGFRCMKPQSCITPRPLACMSELVNNNRRTQTIAPTRTDVRGSSLATRSDADRACASDLGPGFTVMVGTYVTGEVMLTGTYEYWAHNSQDTQANCWETDYR